MAKKVKEESALKKKIKEMKKTPKGKAILKLIGWGIFFFLLFIFCLIASLFSSPITKEDVPSTNGNMEVDGQPNESEKVIDEETQKISLLDKLSVSNYDYEYEIIINGSKYVFNGSKKGNINTGYKESANGIIKYYIDDTLVYQQTTTDKILITNLFENINLEYLDLSNLVNKVKNLKFEIPATIDFYYPTYSTQDNDNAYYISYADSLDKENNYVNIITIKALDGSYQYTFKFDNVEVKNED